MHRWLTGIRSWARQRPAADVPVIGLALGGGFARGIAHLGVLRVLERHNIPVGAIAGVSAGAIVAAAYASGTPLEEIVTMGRAMRFKDIASWTVSTMGLAASERMTAFLRKLLRVYRFEEMRIPLAVVATDLNTGQPVVFRDQGDVFLPVRASCSYPGLFQPVRYGKHFLVDGAISLEVPAPALHKLGASHAIAVSLPANGEGFDPRNMFHVINRCFQVMHTRTQRDWQRHSNLVIEPDVNGMSWDCWDSCDRLIEAGERAALAALPRIQGWLERRARGPWLVAGGPALDSTGHVPQATGSTS